MFTDHSLAGSVQVMGSDRPGALWKESQVDVKQLLAKAPNVSAVGITVPWQFLNGHGLELEAEAAIGEGDARASRKGWQRIRTAMDALAECTSFRWTAPEDLGNHLRSYLEGARQITLGRFETVYRRRYTMVLVVEVGPVRMRMTAQPDGELDVEAAIGAMLEFVMRLGHGLPSGRELVRALRAEVARGRTSSWLKGRPPLGSIEAAFLTSRNDDLLAPPAPWEPDPRCVEVMGLEIRRVVCDEMPELFGPLWRLEAGALRRDIEALTDPGSRAGRILARHPGEDGSLALTVRTADVVRGALHAGSTHVTTVYTAELRFYQRWESTAVYVDSIWAGALGDRPPARF